jgi:hypothetical protein
MRPRHHILASDLVEIFRQSLQNYPSAAQSTESWRQSCAREKALEFVEVNSTVAKALRDGQTGIAVINDPNLVHILWLLDLDGHIVQKYIELLLAPWMKQKFGGTKFWIAYIHAIAVFSRIPASLALKPKLAGYEKFWEPYLDFMAGAISREEFAVRAANSFAKRNNQSKCIDWLSLDGDAKKPVKWDFRYAAILRKADQFSAPNAGSGTLPGNSEVLPGPSSLS